MEENEIWKAIPGYEGYYEVSSIGNVRSLDRVIENGRMGIFKRGKILKQKPDKDGYLRVSITKDNKRHKTGVHRLVALAFCEKEDGLDCVNHKDENKQNNHYSNLEWCTIKYNNNYNGRQERIAEKNSYKVQMLDLSGSIVAEFKSAVEAGKTFGNEDGSIIASCCRGDILTAYGYKWRYADEDKRYNTDRVQALKKSVDQYTRDMQYIQTFRSMKEASDATGLFCQSIGACCRGKINHTGGFVFRFHDKTIDNSNDRKVEDYYKRVSQYSLDGSFIATHESISKAALATGMNPRKNHIRSCCLGTRNQCGGYKWKYE